MREGKKRGVGFFGKRIGIVVGLRFEEEGERRNISGKRRKGSG